MAPQIVVTGRKPAPGPTGRVVYRRTASRAEAGVIASRPQADEAISASTHAQVKRDCFAEFILGLAEGETEGSQ